MTKKRALTVVGARPQFIKAAAVSRAFRGRPDLEERIVHTGQHFDPGMSDVFFDELDIPAPAHNLDIHGGQAAYSRRPCGGRLALVQPRHA